MRELRLHRALYAPGAVDAAVGAYARFASIERADDAAHFVVRVHHESDARERRVAGELGNHALGQTVVERGSR